MADRLPSQGRVTRQFKSRNCHKLANRVPCEDSRFSGDTLLRPPRSCGPWRICLLAERPRRSSEDRWHRRSRGRRRCHAESTSRTYSSRRHRNIVAGERLKRLVARDTIRAVTVLPLKGLLTVPRYNIFDRFLDLPLSVTYYSIVACICETGLIARITASNDSAEIRNWKNCRNTFPWRLPPSRPSH